MNAAKTMTLPIATHAGDRVLAGLVNVCAPQVKGAHDSDLVNRLPDVYRELATQDLQLIGPWSAAGVGTP